MKIKTRIDIKHIELIKVFLKANQMNVDFYEDLLTIRNVNHKVLILECLDDDSEQKFSYMGMVHSGIQNMFDHYLMKCGVLVDDIEPDSIKEQIHIEKQKQQEEEFQERLKAVIAHKRGEPDPA